jgi:hypothetical protein
MNRKLVIKKREKEAKTTKENKRTKIHARGVVFMKAWSQQGGGKNEGLESNDKPSREWLRVN